MKKISGTFNGTGAAIYLCLGFIPDAIRFFNFETSNDYEAYWDKIFARSLEFVEGMQVHTGTTYRQITAQTIGLGIIPHYGGTTLSTTTAGTVTYGEGIYLSKDTQDYRKSQPVGAVPDEWTLNTSAANTGQINASGISSTYCGEGSQVCIDGKWYTVVDMTSNGEATNEITLNAPAPSGALQFFGGMYDYAPMIAGEVSKEGVYWANTTINANDALIGFVAELWDD